MENSWSLKLATVHPWRRLYADHENRYYLILGGSGNWHGISPDLMDFLDRHSADSKLIITKKYGAAMLVFSCPASHLIDHKNCLKRTERGDYHFNVDLAPSGDLLRVLEVPGLTLSKLGAL